MGATLIVYVKPSKPVITKISTPILGQSMTLQCSATSNSKPDNHSLQMKYTWRRDSTDIPINSRYKVSGTFLRVTNIQKDDQGTVFTCAAFETGSMMSDMSDGHTIEVKYGPTTVSTDAGQQLSIVENTGTLGPITCSAECEPECKYQWKFNGVNYGSPDNTLTVNNIHRNSSGTYSCTASNAHGAVSSKDIVVTVEYGPDTVSPNTALQLSLVENTDTLGPITCSADCVPGCTYQWQYNGVNYGSPGDTLIIDNITRALSGTYRCIAANKYGRNRSDNITVRVEYGPGNVSPNTAQQKSLVENNSTLGPILCNADCVPACVYQWKFNGTDLGKTGSTLNLNNIQRTSAGTYWCIASNTYGDERSQSIVVDVSYGPDRVLPSTRQTKVLVENIDTLGPITCRADCKPACTYQWKYNGKIFGSPGDTLTINNIQRASDGTYWCNASNAIGSRRSNQVIVYVEYAPKNLVVQPSTLSYVVLENKSRISLTCTADCSPSCKYRWLYDGGNVARTATSRLYLWSIDRQRRGNYSCIAWNRRGSRNSQTITVDVHYKPGKVLPRRRQIINLVESTDTLGPITCRADCKPACTYQWKVNDTDFGSPGDTLTINNIQRTSTGLYKCNASNVYGFESSSIVDVYVKYGPGKISLSPKNTTYTLLEKIGTLGPISCTADCLPLCSYIWTKDGVEIDHDLMARQRTANRTMAGQYRCTAKNIHNMSSVTIDVIIEYGPGTVSPATSQQFTLVENAGKLGPIKCSAHCVPACTYQWLINGADFGIPEDTLTINNIQRSSAGTYWCVASNTHGHCRSKDVVVDVEYVPEYLVLRPPNLSYVLLENATLGPVTCSSSCNPPCKYRWLRDGTNITQTAVLQINDIDRQRRGNYSCVAWNRQGSLSSKVITVAVQYGPWIVTIVPKNRSYTFVEKINGTLGPIACQADCNSECLYRWTRDDFILPDQGKTLTIHNVLRDKAGMYRCIASDLDSQLTAKSSAINVIVEYGPRTVSPKTMQYKYLSENTEALGPITCNADCQPVCTYQWRFNGAYFGTKGNILTINNIQRTSTGTYWCVASNTHGTGRSKNIAVYVEYAPERLVLQPYVSYVVFEKVTLGPINCTADCYPVCQYRWLRDGKNVTQSAVLHITEITVKQGGSYSCMAWNRRGSLNSENITIDVQSIPGEPKCSSISPSLDQSPFTAGIGMIAIGGICLVVALVLTVYNCRRWNSRDQMHAKSQNSGIQLDATQDRENGAYSEVDLSSSNEYEDLGEKAPPSVYERIKRKRNRDVSVNTELN